MAFNAPSKFPEYNENVNDDMYPDRDANFAGWVLQVVMSYTIKKTNIIKLFKYVKKQNNSVKTEKK